MKEYTFSDLDESLLVQYRAAVLSAFPKIVLESQVGKAYWPQIEKYFPSFQLFLVDEDQQLIGFFNGLPLFWNRSFGELPEAGWDWLLQKGMQDHMDGKEANCLGGLQIIVCKKFRGKGYSKILIAKGKELKSNQGLDKFIIPIRPTFKYKHPNVSMEEYIRFRRDGQIYDPWIRTHLSSGAEIVKVCSQAMYTSGSINFWEEILLQKIETTGQYQVDGALNPVYIDIGNNIGEYWEENVWIKYP